MKKFFVSLLLVAPFFKAAPVNAAPKAAPLPYPASVESLKKQIAARKGKVVLVNFWATWCTPCVAELPLLEKLQKQNAKKLSVLLISADETGQRAQAAQLLGQKGHTGPSWIIAGSQESFLKKFDPKAKELSLPRTYLFGRDGKLIKAVSADEAKNLEAIVKKLLK
jgi:thiol-disulfide isomerase/thioredoxin